MDLPFLSIFGEVTPEVSILQLRGARLAIHRPLLFFLTAKIEGGRRPKDDHCHAMVSLDYAVASGSRYLLVST